MRRGLVWRGVVGRGLVVRGVAGSGEARFGYTHRFLRGAAVWSGPTRLGRVWCGLVRQGVVGSGRQRLGWVGLHTLRPPGRSSEARYGNAGQGPAWSGEVWPGKARLRRGAGKVDTPLPTGSGSQLMNNENNEPTGAVKLPLWRNCLDYMQRNEMIYYGAVFPADFFEEQLREKRDSMQFGLAVSRIRAELLPFGFYLSGRGQNGNSFLIVPPENNSDVASNKLRTALKDIEQARILCEATATDTLDADQQRKLDHASNRAAKWMGAIVHTEQVRRFFRKEEISGQAGSG